MMFFRIIQSRIVITNRVKQLFGVKAHVKPFVNNGPIITGFKITLQRRDTHWPFKPFFFRVHNLFLYFDNSTVSGIFSRDT